VIGDVFETATCAGCGKPIQHRYWGNGGNHWEHDGGSWECSKPTLAKPIQGTVVNAEPK
jgi:hypothetical protein